MPTLFYVYRDIEYYRSRTIGIVAEEYIFLDESDLARVFNSKTQGYPYHSLLLSLVALAEERFPGAAIADGDLEYHDWQKCLNRVKDLIGKPVAQPLRLSPAKLWEVLSKKYQGLDLVDKVSEEMRCKEEDLLKYVIDCQRELLGEYLTFNLKSSKLGEIGGISFCKDYLDASPGLEELIAVACQLSGWGWRGISRCLVNTGLLDGGSKQDFYQRPEGILGLFAWSMNPRSYETVKRISLEDFVSMVSRIAGEDAKKVLSYVKRRIKVRKDEMKGLEEAEAGILEGLEEGLEDAVGEEGVLEGLEEAVGEEETPVDYETLILSMPKPPEMLESIRKVFAEQKIPYDLENLRRANLKIAISNYLILDREVWDIFDGLEDIHAHRLLLSMFSKYEGNESHRVFIQEVIKRLERLVIKWNES